MQDLNTHRFSGEYDFILSTVVMMFLERQQIPPIVQNMQDSTVRGGHNLIVAAMDTEDYPCPLPFPFTFSPGELKHYYRDWGSSIQRRRRPTAQDRRRRQPHLAALRHPAGTQAIARRERSPQRVALAGAYPADAVAQIDPIVAFHSRHRPVMHGEHHRVALLQRHHLRPALHPRPLFGQHEFAAGEVPFRGGK